MSRTFDIAFTLNGRPVTAAVPAHMSALTMLRDVFTLTGSKLGCNEGECGACTILVDGRSQNACLLFAVDCDGRNVLTIEAMETDRGLLRLKDAFVAHGAVQCGFCTPGMVMQAREMLGRGADPDPEAVKRGLEGNLCRCTGYRKIIDAVSAALAGDAGGDGAA